MKKVGRKIVVPSLRFMTAKIGYIHKQLLKFFVYIFGAALFLMMLSGWTNPQSTPAGRGVPSKEDQLKQFKTALLDLKNAVSNHESEIRILEDKLLNQESSFDHFKQQLTDDVQSQKDVAKTCSINLEGKTDSLEQSIHQLEALVKGLTADFRQMKTQANDSVTVLAQYKQKITELSNLVETQNHQIQNLEAALNSMLEVMQGRHAPKAIAIKSSESESRTYKVQAGDNLEKIARNQKISVQALREANPQISHDRINIGQTLKIP